MHQSPAGTFPTFVPESTSPARPAFSRDKGTLPLAADAAPAATPGAGRRLRVDRPPYAVVARRYLRVLVGLESWARLPGGDASVQMFLERLRIELAASLERHETTPYDDGERTFVEAQLQWLCNQCEHWLGPAAKASLDNLAPRTEPPRCPPPAVTDGEHAAVALLWRIVAWLGEFRHPKWRLPPQRTSLARLLRLRCGERLRHIIRGAKRVARRFL